MPPERYAVPHPPLTDRDRLAQSLRKAFPVPDCGSFAGLLSAVGNAERRLHS